MMKRSQIKRRPLADTVLSTLEPEDKDYRELDGNGLYFRVRANGAKGWNLRYKKPNGKWSWLGLGSFPAVSGRGARKKAQELIELASEGIDISSHRAGAAGTGPDAVSAVVTFADQAEEWYRRKKEAGRSPATLKQMRLYLDKDILPAIGHRDITQISRLECARLQETVEQRGSHTIAEKMRRWVGQVFSQAVARGVCELNPASELAHIAAPAPKMQNYPHLLEPEIPEFLRELRASTSRDSTLNAIRMVLLTASRPGMVRHAEWSEIDLNAATWSISAAKMKIRREFVVPLPCQLVELLSIQKEVTGIGRYVFPGVGHVNSMMSENTINKALGMIGYKGKMVGHGARHTASTLLREHGWKKDYVEAQLAHVEPGTAGVYNKAAYLEQRRVMMQWYADYLVALEAGLSEQDRQRFDAEVKAVH